MDTACQLSTIFGQPTPFSRDGLTVLKTDAHEAAESIKHESVASLGAARQ
jgi:hypothetical protein